MTYSVLEQKILKTVCYFDLFNFPLTSWEVYRNLYLAKGESIELVFKALTNLMAIKALDFNQGFYFLPNRVGITSLRKERYLLAQPKMRIALRYARMLKQLPFVQAIFVCNSLSYQNSKPESDIDFAIVAKGNRIWTCRFFCAGLMALLHLRPTDKTQKNRLCLSFFVSDANLNLQIAAYPEDIHFIYWLKQFLPIYDRGDYVQKFAEANAWLNKLLPNYSASKTNTRWMTTKPFRLFFILEKILQTKLGKVLEIFLKKIQLKIMPLNLINLAETENTDVVLNDDLLKFHNQDKRQEIKKLWEQSCNKNICQN